MVDIPGGLGANDGFWMQQLRDRFGRFMEMGGEVLFEVTIPGVQGEVQAKGKYIGATDMTTARIEVPDNSEIPRGVYLIKTDKIQMIEAIIPQEYLDEQLDKAKATPEPLKKSMLGSEVQKEKLRSISRMLKAKGRFPVPRQSNLDTWAKTSDVGVAAKADYKQVYDASPELQEKYSSAEELWDRVYKLSVDTDWSSPNDLSEIPEEMRLINRQYAKHFLGLEEDGLITVYRNAVNGKTSQVDAAAGYVSTDMSLAYDYNSKQENIGANGRYEIDVKPDEIFGMLGYSKPEDEFAFVVGKGVTSQEDRVRRVGDLASLPMPAPWLNKYEKEIAYSRGATPYRHHALGGQFDFHEVEDFGNTVEEFFSKYNLTSADIKSKFDQLYGEGAYDEYKASKGTIYFSTIRNMFVDLPNGKIGLDITKILGGRDGSLTSHAYGDTSNPDSYKNDLTDSTLKMLSVFQELTGQPFFTHRSRDYAPGAEPPKDVVPPTQDRDFKDIDEGSYRKLVAYQNNESVAQVEYNLVPDETRSDGTLRVEVQYIKSFIEGKGHGQAVMHELYAMYPNSIIDWGETLNETSRNMAEKFDAQYSRTEYRYGEEEGEDGDIFKKEPLFEEKKTGIFQEYDPEQRTEAERSNAAEDTPLSDLGFDPEEEVTVYRGVPEDADSINPGDWVTTLPQLAKDYAGTGKVISMKVKAKDLLADPSSGEGAYTEEMVYQPRKDTNQDAASIFEGALDAQVFDISKLGDKRHYAEDPEMFKPEEVTAIKQYTGSSAFKIWNKALRNNDTEKLSEIENDIKLLDAIIADHGEVYTPARVFRGLVISEKSSVDWKNIMENLSIGDTILDEGYVSTSNSPEVAYGNFGGGIGRKLLTEDGKFGGSRYMSNNALLQGSVFWSIDLPVGAKAFGVPEGMGHQGEAEDEVILPRGSSVVVKSIRKVQHVDADGNPIEDAFNYFLETELVPQGAPEVVEAVDKLKDSGVEQAVLDSLPTKETATEEQARAVARYTHQAHDSINNYLRYIGGDSRVSNPVIDYSSFDGGKYVINKWTDSEFTYTLDDVLEHIESLDALIEQAPGVIEDTTLYRYLQDWMLSGKLLKTLKPGDEMEDKGFISTTRGNFKPSDSSNLKMIINVPKGTKGLYIDWFKEGSFSDSGEQEVLLPRGTKFVVTKIEDNQVYVDIRESSDEDSVESEDFYIKDPADDASKKVTFGYEKTKVAGFDEDAILITAFLGDRKLPIGNLHLDSKTRMVKNISVLEDYQRQGVATELWRYAQGQGLEPKHSPLKTPEGEKWAESVEETGYSAKEVESVEDSAPGLWGRIKLRELKDRVGYVLNDDPELQETIKQYSGSDESVEKLEEVLRETGAFRKALAAKPVNKFISAAEKEYKNIVDPNIDTKTGIAPPIPYGDILDSGLGTTGYVSPQTVIDSIENFTNVNDRSTDANKVREEAVSNGFTSPIVLLYNEETNSFNLKNPEYDSLRLLGSRVLLRESPVVVEVDGKSSNPRFFPKMSTPKRLLNTSELPEDYPDISGVPDLPVPERSQEEKDAIEAYRGWSYLDIKTHMETSYGDLDKTEEERKKLDEIVENLDKVTEEPLPEGTVLYRGFGLYGTKNEEWYEYFSEVEAGDTLMMPIRVTSTTLDMDIAESFSVGLGKTDPDKMRSVVLKITTGKGATGAAFENDKTVFSREKEVLLPGLANVKVTRAYKDYDGVIRIEGLYESAKKNKE